MIFIGTPTYDGKLCYQTIDGILGMMHICAKHNVGFAHDVVPGDAFVGHARNAIVHRFLASGARDLMFIDADIGFDPLDVVKLCQAEPELVCGLYRMKMEREKFPAQYHDPVEQHPSDPNLVRLRWGPTGFMRIRASVFEKMREKWPDDWYIDGYNNEKTYDFFPHGRIGNHFRSEDIGFCSRAAELGIKLWAMQGIELQHVGTKSYESKWELVKPTLTEAA